MKDFLMENNVGIKHFISYPKSRSRLAVAFIDDINNPNYVFYKLNTPTPPKLSYPDIEKDDIIIFGSFFGIKEAIRDDMVNFLNEAKLRGALILYDPNFRVNHIPLLEKARPYILENMDIAHITKGSNDDFKLIFDADTIEEALDKTGKFRPEIFLYTANKNGISWSLYGNTGHYPVVEIAPLSAIGAGDAFNAGLAYAFYTLGITTENLKKQLPENLNNILKTADDFAVDVCLSFENYISDEIGKKYFFKGTTM